MVFEFLTNTISWAFGKLLEKLLSPLQRITYTKTQIYRHQNIFEKIQQNQTKYKEIQDYLDRKYK